MRDGEKKKRNEGMMKEIQILRRNIKEVKGKGNKKECKKVDEERKKFER